MTFEVHTSTDVFEALAQEWNALLQQSITNTPFSTLQWHSNWWTAYHPGDLFVLTFRDEDQCLRAIASLFIAQQEGQRVVHFVGCEDVTDYLDFVVDQAQQERIYEAMADALVAVREHFDSIDLCNIPAESPTHTLFPEILRKKGFEVSTTVQEVCPVIYLPQTFPDYIKSLDKKQGKELARKLRIADGQADSIEWYTVDERHDLDEEIAIFLKLMASSHPEKAQFLEDEQHVQFFHSIVSAAFSAGWLQLNIMKVVGEPAAAYINFDYNNQILVYNSGLDPDRAAKLSPGIVLLAYNIQQAIEQGRETFNFLRGDEEYKYRMGGQDTEIFNLKAKFVQ